MKTKEHQIKECLKVLSYSTGQSANVIRAFTEEYTNYLNKGENMAQHVHAKEMMQYAEDATKTDKPWELWEYIDYMGWRNLSTHPTWLTGAKYRRKPEYIDINGFKVPKPVTSLLEEGKLYYSPVITTRDDADFSNLWRNSILDYRRLRAGLVHLTKEAAEIHAEALLSFTKDLI